MAPRKTETKSSATTLKGVNRALEVLSHVAIHPGRVVDIVERLGASWATLHRTLSQLEAKNFIKRDDSNGEFSIGPRMWLIGATYVANHPVLEVARPYLDEFADSSTFTVQLAEQMDRLAIVLYSRHKSGEEITKATYGYHFPLHCGSKGQVLLAFSDTAAQNEFLKDPLEKLTANTIVDDDVMRQTIAKIRQDGYAITIGDVQSFTGSVAAPIFDRRGKVAASVCLITRRSFFDDEAEVNNIIERLLHACQSISISLGWRPGRFAGD